ncbi:MAG TPA: hypothetical protein VK939_06000 [Longimicrobiales bacterium]|nr:hypothetical protein [Longimicrobiales bacterium]
MRQKISAWQAGLLAVLASVVMAGSHPFELSAQVADPGTVGMRDGASDFDFEFGMWRTQLRRLAAPLTGSDAWVEYEGTSVIRPVLDGRANLVELEVEGPSGRIEGLSLRLYDPEARQWSLNFSNIRTGHLSPPVVGQFRDGRGEFYGQERIDGRTVLVRFVISDITPTSARFEQAFSDDGGRSWEVNWIAVDTKIEERPSR